MAPGQYVGYGIPLALQSPIFFQPNTTSVIPTAADKMAANPVTLNGFSVPTSTSTSLTNQTSQRKYLLNQATTLYSTNVYNNVMQSVKICGTSISSDNRDHQTGGQDANKSCINHHPSPPVKAPRRGRPRARKVESEQDPQEKQVNRLSAQRYLNSLTVCCYLFSNSKVQHMNATAYVSNS